MSLDTKALIAKLGKPCRKALEEAAESCVSHTHFSVELEHLLLRLLARRDSEFAQILRYYEIDTDRVEAELLQALDTMKRGNGRTPTLAPRILEAIEAAWLISSVQLGSPVERSGALLLGILDRDTLRGAMAEAAPSLLLLPRDRLRADFVELVRNSAEDEKAAPGARPAAVAPAADPAVAAGPGPARDPGALGQFTIDLTANAREGRIDPILGRDAEIRQVIDILMRRRQNNPILTGEAGVGKTAVAEGLALRIAAGDVPEPLRNVTIRVLDLGLLQAGAGLKGEFEQRLKNVIAEVAASPTPIILFIDEAHTLIGAGGSAGQGDAANLLKPALARGELRTIAATTWAEYRKYFEKDPALARRFQVVKVAEPSEPAAEIMLRGLVGRTEAHHQVHILDEAVTAAVRLSHRYISGRQLPDKAISVLDTACARVAVAQASTPPAVEAAIRRTDVIEHEIRSLERDVQAGVDHSERLSGLHAELETAKAERAELEARWQREQEHARELLACLDEAGRGEGGRAAALPELKRRLAEVQGEEPMVPVWVDAAVVAGVIAGWTGIPVGRMLQSEMATMLSLETLMGERLVGQPQALEAIARRIRTHHAGLGDPEKPVGVFLLAGPSGVGKTETAITLADLMYGGERSLIVINMSEFQEAHTVALLKGAPPGYVGYGTGGILTEAVRRQPYSVILLDEIEKAHPDVLELFYQVFDKGRMEDSEGIEIDFRNTLILMTSNLGSTELIELAADSGTTPSVEAAVEAIRPILVRALKPALLARMVVVPYFPLADESLRRIVDLKLDRVRRRLSERHGAELRFAPDLARGIAARCLEVDSGARNVDHILTGTLLPQLSDRILSRMADGKPFRSIAVGLDGDGFTYTFDEAS